MNEYKFDQQNSRFRDNYERERETARLNGDWSGQVMRDSDWSRQILASYWLILVILTSDWL